IIQKLLLENIALALDTMLLDSNAGSTTRPAGLRNGVSALTATAGGSAAALIGDISKLTALSGGVGAIWSDLLFIASVREAAKIAAYIPLFKYPVVASAAVAEGQLICVVPSSIVMAGSPDAPRLEVSRDTALHMEDTSPTAISTAGTPNTIAAPVRS